MLGRKSRDHFVILQGYRLAGHDLTDAFWATGDLTILPDRLVESGYQRMRVPSSNGPGVRVIGVRFEEAGISEIEYQTGIVARPSHVTPPLDDATKVYGYKIEEAVNEPLPAPNVPTPPPPAAPPARTSATRDDPPISDATLRVWWVMCQTIKHAEAWSHDDIRAFYDRCFPDRFLSRDRQRQLRPDGAKPGKKA